MVGTQSGETGFTPPYMTFATLGTFLTKMGEKGFPARIDRSALGDFSGATQYQLLQTLETFGLIDESGRPSAVLRSLVEEPDRQKEIIGGILEAHYGGANELGRKAGTERQLVTWFVDQGISGSTVRKAIRFYLQAAEFAGIPTSPYFKTPSAKTVSSSNKKPKAKRKKAPQVSTERVEPDDDPIDALRAKYIGQLMEKGLGEDQLDPQLLDRIERLLGFQDEGAAAVEAEKEGGP